MLAGTPQVLLFPRPRRFGKTLLLSTVQAFVERGDDDRAALFGDLTIWNDAAARQHMARYPVVFMTFKDVKYSTWDECVLAVATEVARAFRAHRELRAALTGHDAATFDALLERRADTVQLAAALSFAPA